MIAGWLGAWPLCQSQSTAWNLGNKESGPARLAGQCTVPTQVLVIGTALGMMRIIYPTAKCRALRAIIFTICLLFRAIAMRGVSRDGPVQRPRAVRYVAGTTISTTTGR